MNVLFLTLRTFSATGGIEKVCRVIGKALYEQSIENNGVTRICSMYDDQQDAYSNPYFPAEIFRGYRIDKLRFITDMVKEGKKFEMVILSHVNLLLVGWMIKRLTPTTKLVLLAHGIEIWYPLNRRITQMLQRCDLVLAVSNYTRQQILTVHQLPEEKVKVINNCLDPFLPLPPGEKKKPSLMKKYGFKEGDKILMTLTRVSSKERYKGYDKVIEAMSMLRDEYPQLKYLIAGKYDGEEKRILDELSGAKKLRRHVVMPGYIDNAVLADHFALSDIYVMPSRKEGFGIVFIEAMYYGLPVIAGNEDGSSDALLNGKLGQLISPENVDEIAGAISNIISDPVSYVPDRNLLVEKFSYGAYKEKLGGLLQEYSTAA